MPRLVWATREFLYHGRMLAKGQVTELRSGFEDTVFILVKDLLYVHRDDILYKHDPTGFLFIHPQYLDAFAEDFASRHPSIQRMIRLQWYWGRPELEPDTSGWSVISPASIEALPRIKRSRGRPPSPNSSARIPDFVDKLENISLPLAKKWGKKLRTYHVYRSDDWIKWHDSSDRSTFYRLLKKHEVDWEKFKKSLLSQIFQ